MAIRTTAARVEGIIEVCGISLTPFIRLANVLTDRVAANNAEGCLDSAGLIELETLLAAHFYTLRDQQYQSRSTGRASATFQGRTDMGLNSSYYGQMAIALDCTGTLADLGRRNVGMAWLGTETDSPRPDGNENS